MTIRRRTIVHDGPGGPFEGVFAWDDAQIGARPAVLVIPNVLGQKESDNLKAEALAALGYAAFACDLSGRASARSAARAPAAIWTNSTPTARCCASDCARRWTR